MLKPGKSRLRTLCLRAIEGLAAETLHQHCFASGLGLRPQEHHAVERTCCKYFLHLSELRATSIVFANGGGGVGMQHPPPPPPAPNPSSLFSQASSLFRTSCYREDLLRIHRHPFQAHPTPPHIPTHPPFSSARSGPAHLRPTPPAKLSRASLRLHGAICLHGFAEP